MFIKIEPYADCWIDPISGGDSKVLDVIRSIYEQFNSVSPGVVAHMKGDRSIVQGYTNSAQPWPLNGLKKFYLPITRLRLAIGKAGI